jgi:predicted amidophosphoribosyltransferase
MRLLSPMTLIVVVVLGFCLLAGLAIILRSARGDRGSPRRCAQCGAGNRPGARYCSRCGVEMSAHS